MILSIVPNSSSHGGVLDHTIEAKEQQHNDFFCLNKREGYHELSSKTQIYFSSAVAKWDADFYIKVDDDVHVNLGVKYHEPEYWKFGEEGNKNFRHATGQI
ncbi:hypothetical protein ARALYDRAFT_910954 [Arabidopsis lyrata subsp. lyrata]|uniref:Hexosyltransferase n=1 Tax=Arabidopsis lyrata subsp. lyrata TaxID=81972 RepID=D7M6X1_ARALL|nr:hypothetical protein ARALYDRAFT_910954 [Arabidopsis lyrata subsp. lyrata]